ncbi:MAG TPA: hypothetical protein VEQ10_18425 [Vicinamibacteria bacterium]|nr:hypothetical protein [Vicinamibacteria bacterium]
MASARYPAAAAFAARLAGHFARHAATAGGEVPARAPVPDAATVEAVVDAGFWASLQREEGIAPEISLAFLAPERAGRPLLFSQPLPLSPQALARLAPAVQRPGIHLGVWRGNGDALAVWGTTRTLPAFCFVLEVLEPGLLVVKHSGREPSAKFRNVAVFQGEQVKVLSRQAPEVASHPTLLRELVGPEAAAGGLPASDLLLRLAVSMRAHRRGGTLLVVPAGSETWRGSIVGRVLYAVVPPFTELADLARLASGDRPRGRRELAQAVEAVAGLTAVDGATVLTDAYEVRAFGVKIGRADGRSRVEQVLVSEPVEGDTASVVAPGDIGATRHISAAQFAHDQPDALALVASQDGRFTAFAWSAAHAMVHAYRLEALLL